MGWKFWQKAPQQEQQEEKRSLENPAVGIGDAAVFEDAFTVSAGEPVNRETALSVPAVWAAINVLSSTIAALPLNVYRKSGDDRERLSNTAIQKLLHGAPNRRWTSYRWRRYMMQSILLDGRSYNWIDSPTPGVVRAIWPLDPASVTPKLDPLTQRMTYAYQPDSSKPAITYDESEILDIPWMLQPNGIDHVKPLEKLKRAIGLSIALEKYATGFFDKGGVPPLQLIGPFRSGQAAQRAGDEISRRLLAKARNGDNVLVLPDGHELKQIGYNPEQSQLMDSRRFQIEEVARVYDLSPSFLQDLTRSTFSNEEQKALHFVKHTVTQWVTAIEQEMNLKIFGMSSPRFVEFNMEGLLRGDFQTRMGGYATAIQNSINTPNEVRRRENLPPMDGGNELVLQQNMMPLGKMGQMQEPAPAPAKDSVTEDSEDEQ